MPNSVDVQPEVLREQARQHDGPVLIEFVVEQHDMVYPMVPAGADLHQMIRRPHPGLEKKED